MSDELPDQDVPTTQPEAPATSSAPPSPEPSPGPTEPVSNHPVVVGGHRKKSKTWLVILIIVLLGAAAALVYVHNHQTKTTTTVASKKDIPYLTYGLIASEDLTPAYPTETADTVNTILIDSQLYEGLVYYQDQTKIKPLLATSWYNPDSSTWIFNLRQGVKFHSGRTMTADDVKYSLDYAIAHQNDNSADTILAFASSIKQVDVINSHQVKITTDGPDAVLLNRLANLYIIDSKAKLGDPNASTGPYTVKPGTTKPNATSLDLVAYDSYWGGHVYTRAVHLRGESDGDQLAADTAKGQFDIAGDFNSKQLATIKAKATYYQPLMVPDLGTNYLELNTAKASSPLHSLAARQAMASALNIPAILKAGGLVGTQANQLIPPSIPGYDPTIKNTAYDLAKAKQLLASVPNAATSLTLNYPPGDDAPVAEIAKELTAAGFTIKLAAINDFGALLKMTANGQGDLFYLGYSSSTLDGVDIINNTVANTKNYSNPELTTLLGQASSSIDPASRIATLQKIERLIAADDPAIALYAQTRTYTLTKPYVIKNDMPAIDSGNYFWQIYQK